MKTISMPFTRRSLLPVIALAVLAALALTQLTVCRRAPVSVKAEPEAAVIEQTLPEQTPSTAVYLMGQEVQPDTRQLDLSAMKSADVDEVCRNLALLPELEQVELEGAALSLEEVARLKAAAPQAEFRYVFSLFDKQISTTAETVHFKDLELSDANEPELRQALSVMTGCSAFILEDCGFSDDKLAEIREDYPNTELVWRVWFGTDNRYTALTNQETIRAVYYVTDSTCGPLKYCRNARYVDLGHNEDLSDLSFVGYMPKLEILIVSACAVSDLSGFENCKNLEFLEMAFCGKLSDLSPLAGCTGLKNLNVCFTKVEDLTPVAGLPLEQLFCRQTRVPEADQETFQQTHPDCIASFSGDDAYNGPGWRYADDGETYTEIYAKVREVFGFND